MTVATMTGGDDNNDDDDSDDDDSGTKEEISTFTVNQMQPMLRNLRISIPKDKTIMTWKLTDHFFHSSNTDDEKGKTSFW